LLTLASGLRVFVAVDPVDMRGSFDALAGRVRRLGLVPEDGGLYVFFSRRGHLVKVLYFDRTGWCCFQKRLVLGTFQVPRVPADVRQVAVDGAALTSLLEGIELRAPRRRWYGRREAGQR